MAKRNIPRNYCAGRWTEAEYVTFIKNALRRVSWKWYPLNQCKAKAKQGRNQYKCASCEGIFGNKDVKVDHVEPVVDPETGFVDWNTFIARLYVEQDGYQLLCKECHNKKTEAENARRKDAKAIKEAAEQLEMNYAVMNRPEHRR